MAQATVAALLCTQAIAEVGTVAGQGTSVSPSQGTRQGSTYSVTPDSGVAPLTVRARQEDRSRFHSTMVASVLWDFGDGTAVRGRNLKSAGHTYTHPGTYTVRWCLDTLTVHAPDGKAKTASSNACPAASTVVGTVNVSAK